jgi:hypothetical protein
MATARPFPLTYRPDSSQVPNLVFCGSELAMRSSDIWAGMQGLKGTVSGLATQRAFPLSSV